MSFVAADDEDKNYTAAQHTKHGQVACGAATKNWYHFNVLTETFHLTHIVDGLRSSFFCFRFRVSFIWDNFFHSTWTSIIIIMTVVSLLTHLKPTTARSLGMDFFFSVASVLIEDELRTWLRLDDGSFFPSRLVVVDFTLGFCYTWQIHTTVEWIGKIERIPQKFKVTTACSAAEDSMLMWYLIFMCFRAAFYWQCHDIHEKMSSEIHMLSPKAASYIMLWNWTDDETERASAHSNAKQRSRGKHRWEYHHHHLQHKNSQ